MMKRNVMTMLVGMAMLIPMNAEAQRNRDRPNRGIDRTAPINRTVPMSGRLINCRAPRNAASYKCGVDARHNVIYRYSRRDRIPSRRLWRSADWGRVRMIPVRTGRVNGFLTQRELRHALGARTVNRIRRHGERIGLYGRLRGHWYETRRTGAVLNVTMDGVQIAELIDFDFDGRADDVLLRRGLAW